GYEQVTAYTLTGQLRSRHLNLPQLDREYTWNDNGQLVRISGPQESRAYRYSDTGRLTGVHTTAANLDIDIPYATDPAGNRLPDPELHPDSTFTAWPDNRIAEDAYYVYRYDEYGRLAEKTDRIPEGVIRMHDERTHHYHYDSQHRLVFYTRIQHGEPLVESRYLYDPLGRRTGKRVWRRERDLTGWMSLSRKPEVTWYGWEGDRLTTVQTQQSRIQTVYQPGSFTPLIRIETENGEQAKARHRSLAEVLQEDTGVTLPAELAVMLGRLERELRAGAVSAESEAWLAQCGLTAAQMESQMEAEYIPERKLHLYHCDHRGLPQALISPEGETAWRGEYDEWGNLLGEENPQHLQQPYRLPGQQYDEESGLYYNRNRYYDPLQGRYITQDPIGLKGGGNLYKYPLNPVQKIDVLGLWGSQSGFWVHQRAGFLVFGQQLTWDERSIVSDAHYLADSAQYQTIPLSYRHAMRTPEQSVSDACQQSNKFVREQFNKAWAAQKGGNRKKALTEFTIGLHTLQDATSPSHSGFQVWDGDLSIAHMLGDAEILDPADDSDLMKTTRDAWGWFQSGKLPDGNLFRCPCE
ncbi:RHS repeat protein, partial [Escherichia albertii]|nr:RHS repeat protein [Escherichia albertii]